MIKYAPLLLCLAAPTVLAAIPPGQWQCMAFDAKEQSYKALGMTMNDAKRAAITRCQSSSKYKPCKTAESFCEQGPLSLMEDRCVVSDGTGRTWNVPGPNACQTALSLCNKWQLLHGKATACNVKHRQYDGYND